MGTMLRFFIVIWCNQPAGGQLRRSDFRFDLPSELIAQQPLERRSDSRLLHLSRGNGQLADLVFRDFPRLLQPRDLLVFNDTRVIPARLHGHKESGGKVEILLERLLDQHTCIAQLRASKAPQPGSRVVLEHGEFLRVEGREGEFYRMSCAPETLLSLLSRSGHVPLPPYIERADTAMDLERYQTVYAARPGAVAAPTAGLHFDQALLCQLDSLGIRRVNVTLHVGAGTFQPVREENIEHHRMHAEYLEVSQAACDMVVATRSAGGRIIAVGTTSVRSLETAAAGGSLQPFAGDSRIFIYPGYEFRVVDGILTNFHLPESTLLMLVSAFAGMESVRAAYAHAIRARYRFFSYGDAMLIT
ncbi:MAG TPA: tRNA preQ1(34) S-adenosylmethionine ribosyltransferase-isomerase QueA [Xanthomonadales bacterium]|nr:tRNA preQ1(34) S-adenosylmethionine ribosyltransferase-isomerase QueA [Xanthomonadales bacterium]